MELKHKREGKYFSILECYLAKEKLQHQHSKFMFFAIEIQQATKTLEDIPLGLKQHRKRNFTTENK